MSNEMQQETLSFAMPPEACDCHTHVFGNSAQYPFSPERTYTPGDAPLAALLLHLKRCHLERVVLVQPSPYGSDNTCLLDALQTIPAIGRGVAVIDRTIADDTLSRMHDAGVRGVRVNLQTHGIDDPAVAARELTWTANRVADLGWHVQMFTNLHVLTQLHKTLLALPTNVVIDHFAHARACDGTQQEGFDILLDMLACGKAWIKASAVQRISSAGGFADVQPILKALIEANDTHVIWGSDWPHPGARPGIPRNKDEIEPFNDVDDIQALNRLAEWVGSNEILKKILVDNPGRLYDFDRTAT
ncbi:hydrolase [Advenella kashmirensis W13003]|uniref:Hydrolase n=1 Tax=Advenella kashmirensis W13003 TaxID=1424334 RepID=V8QY83_9BURK|nr:amidohydrolase family protein [Advenella kashmirensis]ETF04338.1 hydrolase [Advenella kashmirensis W13003]